MMKPSTLVGLIFLFSLPSKGDEPGLATSPTQMPAVPAATSTATVTPPVAAPSTATPVPSTAALAIPPAPMPATPASVPAAPLPTAPASAPLPKAATAPLTTGNLQVVPLYRQDELLTWIEQGRHLTQVKQDRCQLTQDIEARASVMKIPAYQFLWGDMLAWGVCVKPDAQIGVQYMWEAANQGLAPALEQLGRYYWKGILVQKDLVQAETLMREAASLGFQRAQIEWVEMLLQGMGSPLDYEEAYHWLHGTVIGDKATHQKAASLLSRLGNRMPANAIARAKAMR